MNNNDEGVSPVIGVILMVAITVVLAAVVFVLVSRIGTVDIDSNNIAIHKEYDNSFSIIKIDEPVSYYHLTIKDNGHIVDYLVNSSTNLDKNIEAGDTITIDDFHSGSHNIKFIIDNNVVYSDTFTS